MGQSAYVSIIIPAYNEERRIGKSLETVFDFFRKEGIPHEILVVNDGSTDRTTDVVSAIFRDSENGKLIDHAQNQGKGFCVRRGMLAARGQYLFFSDADLSTPIHEVRKFLPLLEQTYDVVIGSRATQGSNVVVRQRKYRELMGKTFNLFVRSLLIGRIRDTQCGFKGFRQAVARDLFRRQRISGFAFDVEIIYLAQRLGYSIREEPIEWYNSFESKVNAITDSSRMIQDLIRIRFMHRDVKPLPVSIPQP